MRKIAISSIISFAFLLSTVIAIKTVYAAGVSVTLSPSAISVAATEVDYSFTSAAEFITSTSDTITIVAPSGVTFTPCASATTDADGDATPDGASAITGGDTYTYTFSLADTTTASTTGVTFCIEMTPSIAGNYGISFTDDKNNYGAALLYAGSANQVNVTASVQPALAFVIRDSGNTGNTNSCALGSLSLATVEACAYRLKITTNADSGFSVQINSDGDLRLSGSGDVADGLDLDPIADNSTITAGTEGYGIELLKESITGGTTTASAAPTNFGTNDSPIPISSATALYSGNGTNNPSSSTYMALITHQAAMDGDTSAGLYSHTLTYTVSASF